MVSPALKVAGWAVVINLVIWIALVGGPGDFYEVRRRVQVCVSYLFTSILFFFSLFFFLLFSFDSSMPSSEASNIERFCFPCVTFVSRAVLTAYILTYIHTCCIHTHHACTGSWTTLARWIGMATKECVAAYGRRDGRKQANRACDRCKQRTWTGSLYSVGLLIFFIIFFIWAGFTVCPSFTTNNQHIV